MPKVAIVTGGAKRVGAEIVRKLHKEGMNVVVHYNGADDEAQKLKLELETIRPNSIKLVKGNILTDKGLARRLVDEAKAAFGQVDCLVNNASIFYETPFGTVTPDQLQDFISVHLIFPFMLIQEASLSLHLTKGNVVNIVDINAEGGLSGFEAYVATKAALLSLTTGLVSALGPNVRINSVSPGITIWPEGFPEERKQAMLEALPLKNKAGPEDVANAVWYLAGAGAVSGTTINVDGGSLAKASNAECLDGGDFFKRRVAFENARAEREKAESEKKRGLVPGGIWC